MPTEAPAPTSTPAQEARQTVTPVPETVKTTQYQRMGGTPLAQMEALHAQNTDLVAWLTIDNVLDLPVVYRDNSYYLTHDFAKNKSTAGTIFLDENHPMTEKTQNLLLHGHNMKDGTMFGTLDRFANESFYSKHKLIQFDTIYEKHTYEVVAAIKTEIPPKGEKVFRYYEYTSSNDEETFLEYADFIEKNKLYDTGVEINPGDKLLTLSTCAYHTTDGRFVVVAKQVS